MALKFLSKFLKDKKRGREAEKKEPPKEVPPAAIPKKEIKGVIIPGVLRAVHITEKASAAAHERSYIFKVNPRANKSDVKRAVEARYGVRVESVRTVNVSGKERRRGKQIGWKQGYKKAVVTLKEGQSIELT